MTFTIRTPNENIILKIFSDCKDFYSTLPARCEIFRIFHIENFTGPCFIPGRELSDGILIPNTIAYDSNPVIRVLNSTSQVQLISNRISDAINLNECDIFITSATEFEKARNREEKLREMFSKKVSKHAKSELIELCVKYADVFALPDDPLTVNNFYQQRLRLKDDIPVYIKNYRLPKTQKDEIDKQVAKLLANDLIEPSVSSFNSPLIVVPKKSNDNTKKWRMCVDYRALNKNLIAEKFPL